MPKTAVITGASSGIGAAYAKRLLADGYDLILVSRRQDKLATFASSLNGNITLLPTDLADPDSLAQLEQKLAELSQIDLLINNAGFGTTGHFADSNLDRQMDMLHVHITATMRLCHVVLPKMLAQNSGGIINVSSIAAFYPTAENVNYSSSKAYINIFTESLAQEIKHSNVKLQSLCPGFTYSDFHDTEEFAHFDRNRVPKVLWMTPEEVVDISLAELPKGNVVIVPGARNKFIVWSSRTLIGNFLRVARKIVRGG